MQKLCSFFDRDIYHVEGGGAQPAVYFIADKDAGGILVNAPVYTEVLKAELEALAPLQILFLPSHFGAQDVLLWKQAGCKLVAQPAEAQFLNTPIDIALDSKLRLTRTIDFLPMSGRTPGSCALRLKNKPGAIFFGPILECASPDQWPTLMAHADDHSWETRIFGSLGLQDVHFEYAFTDTFVADRTPVGPGADLAIQTELQAALDAD
ncbi:hypothetical protein [Acidithiobacillus sulfurivorans]|uniref:MBL fold metallo-hydrolase n=1 Tax=Acidithiobacillus sulfurivorans TaxID=1958756 RepID=A0ABS5ZUY3_9PROT|nr:hypothetical protein [Acidithiobacillus sulfurivorans]MBU2759026.1 hypothetical protein [Acidithiobacillus sulfurivorans]